VRVPPSPPRIFEFKKTAKKGSSTLNSGAIGGCATKKEMRKNMLTKVNPCTLLRRSKLLRERGFAESLSKKIWMDGDQTVGRSRKKGSVSSSIEFFKQKVRGGGPVYEWFLHVEGVLRLVAWREEKKGCLSSLAD